MDAATRRHASFAALMGLRGNYGRPARFCSTSCNFWHAAASTVSRLRMPRQSGCLKLAGGLVSGFSISLGSGLKSRSKQDPGRAAPYSEVPAARRHIQGGLAAFLFVAAQFVEESTVFGVFREPFDEDCF